MTTNIKNLMGPTGELVPCKASIYQEGVQVAVMHGGSAKLIDRFVKEVAEYCDEPVDWHYVGGRARILTTGDAAKVQLAIRELYLYCQITRR